MEKMGLRCWIGSLFMVWGMGCSRGSGVALPHPALQAMEPFPDEGTALSRCERWYGVSLQGVPAGFVHLRTSLHPTRVGPRRLTVRTEAVAFRRGEKQVRIQVEDRVLETVEGGLLRISHRERQFPGEERRLEAGRTGADLVTVQGDEVRRQPFEPTALGPFGVDGHWLGGQTPVPGVPRFWRAYSVQAGGYARQRIEYRVLGGEAGGFWETVHTDESQPGLWSLQVLDEQGLAVESLSVMGFLRVRLERIGRPAAGADGAWDGPDLTPYLSVATHRPDLDRGRLERVRIRLEGWPEGVLAARLAGPGQEVVFGGAPGQVLLDVRREGEAVGRVPFPPGPVPAELSIYLEPTQLAPAGDPAILAKARDLTRGAGDAGEACRRLRRWVSEEIASSLGLAMASAAQTLARREGDCSEMAILLATLSRAVGIPARCVFGLVFDRGEFQRHMWTEVWLDRWRALDPAMRTDGLTAGWVRFGEIPLGLKERERAGSPVDEILTAPLRAIVEDAEMR